MDRAVVVVVVVVVVDAAAAAVPNVVVAMGIAKDTELRHDVGREKEPRLETGTVVEALAPVHTSSPPPLWPPMSPAACRKSARVNSSARLSALFFREKASVCNEGR